MSISDSSLRTCPVPSRLNLSEHQCRIHAMACAVELHQPAMMHDSVDHRGSQLVIPKHGAPFAELDVRRQYQAAPLIAVRHELEQEPCALDVDRDVSELVQYDEVRLGDVLHLDIEQARTVGLRQHHHQLCGREEPRRHPRIDRRNAHGCREMGFASARLSMEDEALVRADERQGDSAPLQLTAVKPIFGIATS